MGKKREFIHTTIKPPGPQVIEIHFGQKPTVANLWNGCWNPAYRYKNRLDKLPYYPYLKITKSNKEKISDIDIIFAPNHVKSPADYKPLKTPCYNWVNPYFWIDNGYYRKSKYDRLEDEIYNCWAKYPKKYALWKNHPVEEDFEIIFDDIWKICVIEEGKTVIDRAELNCYIWLLRKFVENTFIFPTENIDFTSWERYVYDYLEEAENLIGKQESRTNLKGWHIYFKKTTDSKKINQVFMCDMKYLLNVFFEKVKPDNGVGIFLYKIYNSFANELARRKLFARCAYCGRIADYRKDKKYCSLGPDGRDCGKRARNKRYYEIRGKQRLPKYRRATREMRAFYKEKGIKNPTENSPKK